MKRIATLALAALVVAMGSPARAVDVLVQRVGDALAIGESGVDDGGGYALGTRVFTNSILAPNYARNTPGFNALAAGSLAMPDGAAALPASRALAWNFLPMTVGELHTNLLYWNGVGAAPGEVAFGPPPTNHTLALTGSNGTAFVTGVDALVPGFTIATTSSSGFIHQHRFFSLDNDLDPQNLPIAPTPGVYLAALELRMSGLANSEPFYVAFGTPEVLAATLGQLVRPWIEARVDQLVPPPLAGDYDVNGEVDGADLLRWQRTLGESVSPMGSSADGDSSGFVDAGDLEVWKDSFSAMNASGTAAANASAVPEPSMGALLLGGAAWLAVARRQEPAV